MTMIPDTIKGKEGLQNDCCNDNLDFLDSGDGVEWEEWKCCKCNTFYVIPIEIVRDYNSAEVVDVKEGDYETE